MAESLAISREFFGRPHAEKEQLKIRQPDGARGYQVLGENVTQYKGKQWGFVEPAVLPY